MGVVQLPPVTCVTVHGAMLRCLLGLKAPCLCFIQRPTVIYCLGGGDVSACPVFIYGWVLAATLDHPPIGRQGLCDGVVLPVVRLDPAIQGECDVHARTVEYPFTHSH